MANALYAKGRENILAGSINMTTDNLKCVLVDAADYVVNLATHQYLSDIAAIGRVATSGNLASKTFTNGLFDAADALFVAVTGDPSEAVVIYQDTGVATTSRLIAYIDTATGLPVTPNGQDILVAWDNGANRIFNWS